MLFLNYMLDIGNNITNFHCQLREFYIKAFPNVKANKRKAPSVTSTRLLELL